MFMEVHPEPEKALCDGPNSWPLHRVDPLLRQLVEVFRAVREEGEP
jgi:2-dehydro-3-deoxyphosphooctonate aldolase (KDO 8-P synthase)